MHETSKQRIKELYDLQKSFYQSGKTRDIPFRKEMLKKLKSSIKSYEKEITDALWKDLHKCYEEAFLTEIGIIYSEIDYHIKNLKSWARPEKIMSPLVLLPSSSRIVNEPLGNALIVSPWNYPFQLAIIPLIGAISAGNCAIVKPSPDSVNTAMIIEKIIKECFDDNYVGCIQGGKETNEHLFEIPFDVVFFTGSSKVGSIFMEKFAPHLSKMILELGGKSPCIVDENADIKLAARRIIWGKTINSGQTCIAPDYLLIHTSVKDEFVKRIGSELNEMFGNDIQKSENYGRMITADAFERVSGYMEEGEILLGGKTDASEKFIEPTLLEVNDLQSEVMKTEIFGPVLPVIAFKSLTEVYDIIKSRPKPLAFYYFGDSDTSKNVLKNITSGGACVNDTLMHVANHKIPFGGVGNSGQGSYHGKFSFDAFTHKRSVVKTPTWIDLPLKYAPFRHFPLIKKLF